MMIETRNVWRGIAASLALALFVGNAVFVNNTARADVTWVLQPSTTLTFSAVVGTFTNNQFYELYNAVPQTDNGTGPFPGYNNSLVTSIGGTMTSLTDPVVGNNFLASLNFGAKPSGITSANAQSVVQNSGLWLPNPANGIVTPGVYGTPSPTNVAGTLVASGLYPANEVPDAGRISFQGLWETTIPPRPCRWTRPAISMGPTCRCGERNNQFQSQYQYTTGGDIYAKTCSGGNAARVRSIVTLVVARVPIPISTSCTSRFPPQPISLPIHSFRC